MEKERFFTCPYCSAQISVLIDTTIEHQEYIEDCEACCRPIYLSYIAKGGNLLSFTAAQQE